MEPQTRCVFILLPRSVSFDRTSVFPCVGCGTRARCRHSALLRARVWSAAHSLIEFALIGEGREGRRTRERDRESKDQGRRSRDSAGVCSRRKKIYVSDDRARPDMDADCERARLKRKRNDERPFLLLSPLLSHFPVLLSRVIGSRIIPTISSQPLLCPKFARVSDALSMVWNICFNYFLILQISIAHVLCQRRLNDERTPCATVPEEFPTGACMRPWRGRQMVQTEASTYIRVTVGTLQMKV